MQRVLNHTFNIKMKIMICLSGVDFFVAVIVRNVVQILAHNLTPPKLFICF